MKNTFGTSVCLTIYGESHGECVGAIVDGLAPGITVDMDFIAEQLKKRRPSGAYSTPRVELDPIKILSGVYNGKTTGAPICIEIANGEFRSVDYEKSRRLVRPGHADYTAHCKYHGYEDFRGGGHFSGRVTASVVAAGALALMALRSKGIYIGTHIKKCGGVCDREFGDLMDDIQKVNSVDYAVLDPVARKGMIEATIAAARENDSVGGILETAVVGMPDGVGEPWFDSIESVLSHLLFSIPAVKGVEFGLGFPISDLRGSEANDPFYIEDGIIKTKSNNNGGINGGISNGMPIIFRCAVKPTPSIMLEQETVSVKEMVNSPLIISGRHDPAIVHRARVVVDSVCAIGLCDLLALRYGTDYFRGDDN